MGQMGTGDLARILPLKPFAKSGQLQPLISLTNFATDSLVQYNILSKTSMVKNL